MPAVRLTGKDELVNQVGGILPIFMSRRNPTEIIENNYVPGEIVLKTGNVQNAIYTVDFGFTEYCRRSRSLTRDIGRMAYQESLANLRIINLHLVSMTAVLQQTGTGHLHTLVQVLC